MPRRRPIAVLPGRVACTNRRAAAGSCCFLPMTEGLLMKHTLRLLLGAFLVLASLGTADAKNKLTFAYVTDPSHEAYFHAIRQGIVKSDRIDLELITTSIPALGQAMLGKQYDIIQTSSVIIPAAVTQGLNIQMLSTVIGRQTPGPTASIWVNKDSPITSVDQLKGRRVATYGLGSTATVIVRGTSGSVKA